MKCYNGIHFSISTKSVFFPTEVFCLQSLIVSPSILKFYRAALFEVRRRGNRNLDAIKKLAITLSFLPLHRSKRTTGPREKSEQRIRILGNQFFPFFSFSPLPLAYTTMQSAISFLREFYPLLPHTAKVIDHSALLSKRLSGRKFLKASHRIF